MLEILTNFLLNIISLLVQKEKGYFFWQASSLKETPVSEKGLTFTNH